MSGGTCAICVDLILNVRRREPLGKNGGLVNVCDRCALEAAPNPVDNGSRGVVHNQEPTNSRAARIREHRQRLAREGVCVNGANHGKATHGKVCTSCHANRDGYERKRRRSAPAQELEV